MYSWGVRLTWFDCNGTSTDYARIEVKAILKLETAKTKEVINRLNGTLNCLSKFLPKLSRVLEPLRRLTQKGIEFCSGKVEDKAFTKVKQLIEKQ